MEQEAEKNSLEAFLYTTILLIEKSIGNPPQLPRLDAEACKRVDCVVVENECDILIFEIDYSHEHMPIFKAPFAKDLMRSGGAQATLNKEHKLATAR